MRQDKKGRKGMIRTLCLMCISLIYLLPLVISFTNSFMSPAEIGRNYRTVSDIMHTGNKYVDMKLIPEKATLLQYKKLLLETPVYLNMFWNSVKLTVPVMLGQLAVSSMAAYAFTVLRFKGKEVVFFIYIIVMLLPLQVTLMPNYLVADILHLNGYLAIILPGIFQPFGTFLLRQQMKLIPEACIESARMDGAGHIRIFFMIVLPMVKSGLAAAAMLTLIDYWNLIDQAVIFIQDSEKQPLSTFLANINAGETGVSFAGACFYAVLVLLVLFFGQRQLKEGIQSSGMKG